jgi:uroporphyrinogen decarboxylase
MKSGSGAPEHVDFTVKDRRGWEEHVRPYLLDERLYERRLNFSSYRALVYPAHKKLFDFAHSRNLPVVLHCDGYVESLIPSLIEAGIDCLQPLEVKAGMDLLKLNQRFGDRIPLIGGMDERVLETNDRQAVEAELLGKLPDVMAGSGYVLQVDHSVSPLVEYETYKFFVERGLEVGTYRE